MKWSPKYFAWFACWKKILFIKKIHFAFYVPTFVFKLNSAFEWNMNRIGSLIGIFDFFEHVIKDLL